MLQINDNVLEYARPKSKYSRRRPKLLGFCTGWMTGILLACITLANVGEFPSFPTVIESLAAGLPVLALFSVLKLSSRLGNWFWFCFTMAISAVVTLVLPVTLQVVLIVIAELRGQHVMC